MFGGLFYSAELFLRFEQFRDEGQGPFELNVDFCARGFGENLHLVFVAPAKHSNLTFHTIPSLPVPLFLRRGAGKVVTLSRIGRACDQEICCRGFGTTRCNRYPVAIFHQSIHP
jgi:hypothetical protein